MSTVSHHPVFYFPVELKSRDLDSRLLIAAHCLQRGYPVMVGQQWAIHQNIDRAPRGCLLYKSMNAIQAKSKLAARNAGHLVTSTDEEALAIASLGFFPARVDEAGLNACHIFFAQSDIQKQALELKFPGVPTPIQVTGSARVDLLSEAARPEFEPDIARIRAAHGRFVLVNTNFTHTNSVWKEEGAVEHMMRTGGAIRTEAQKAEFDAYFAGETVAREHTFALVAWMSEHLPDHRVVVRPHPGEDRALWDRTFPDTSRVRIVSGENPVSWVLAADLLVHTNCTTGVEAALLGRAALNLSPGDDKDWAKRYVMREVNLTVTSWEAAAKILAEGRVGGWQDVAAPRIGALEKYYPNRDNAARNIAGALIGLLEARGVRADAPNPWTTSRIEWIVRPRTDVEVRKFSLTRDELDQRLATIRRLSGWDRPLAVGQVDDSLFLMVTRS